jgi:proline racemase
MTKVSDWVAIGNRLQHAKPMEEVSQRYECREGESTVASIRCEGIGRWTFECDAGIKVDGIASVDLAMDAGERVLRSLGYEIETAER